MHFNLRHSANFLRITLALAITTIFFQNCGSGSWWASDNTSLGRGGCALKTELALNPTTIYIDGVAHSLQYEPLGPLTFQVNQTVQFSAGSTPTSCGASPEGQFWGVSDGLDQAGEFHDYCMTLNNAVTGHYQISWSTGAGNGCTGPEHVDINIIVQ